MLSNIRKYLISLAAAVGVLVSMGLLTGSAQLWVIGSITAANAALVYWVPNGKAVPTVDDTEAFDALLHQNEAQHFGIGAAYPFRWPESLPGTGSHAEPDSPPGTATDAA